MNDNKIDVIGLSETRLDENIGDRELRMEGYKIFRNDRSVHGGGVAINVKESLDVIQVDHQMNSLELLSLEIKPKKARSFLSPGTDHQPQM